jgi:MFS transporter, SP family, solute carrier family 2 (myo-inositol transporter), member 13
VNSAGFTNTPGNPAANAATGRYNAFLLLVAGLGGLLYGIDVGIIGGAVPYLQATSGLTASQLSFIVAAVLLGSVFSTLFSGMLADWMGRKPLMIVSGCAFVVSIPVIALSSGYGPLLFGRLLQGASGGLIGVVVPLYLAECLAASSRGKGTAMFQWMLTLGIVAAALMGMYFSYRVDAVAKLGDAAELFRFKDHAWRSIFWVSLPPGVVFVLGSFFVTESPRWLFRKGRKEHAQAALLKSRSAEQAALELEEMEATAHAAGAKTGKQIRDSLLRRKYAIPFLLACVILFCNTATGVNSIIGYNTDILLQSGLSDLRAHWGYVIFTVVNFLATMIGIVLVDRKGRKFLLVIGTSGAIVALASVALLFRTTEKLSVDCRDAVQALVSPSQELALRFDPAMADRLLAAQDNAEQNSAGQGDGGQNDAGHSGASREIESSRASLAIIYSYGGFTAATTFVRSDDAAAAPIEITRASCVPANKVEALFRNPFADLAAARTAPLVIQKALVGRVPDAKHGWLVALGLYVFMAFFALGPGVVVWLALSELMPTRICSNGMSVALVINQLVSTTLAAIFLPFVSKHGYSSMFFLFAGFTVVYFVVAVFFLPETKGKTLEEIEEYFEGTPHRS